MAEGNTGKVRVFQNSSGSWVQLGVDLGQEATLLNVGLGASVALSDDGMTLAVPEQVMGVVEALAPRLFLNGMASGH